MFKPKLFTTLKGYTRADFFRDAVSGLIVGVVALPLAIAFGIASGVSPEKGLITAVVAGFLISALGGSRVQIGGPTGAFVVIVYGIVHKYGVDGLTVATLMAGVILIVFGLAKLGQVIRFIPRSVTIGFTSGIAVIIFSSQIKDFLGLNIESLPPEFFEKWKAYIGGAATWNPWALAIGLGTVAVTSLWPKISKLSTRIPGSLIALVLFSALSHYFKLPVETIGSYFGELPRSLPMPRLPSVDWAIMQRLVEPAFAIALLAGIESLLSAVVADGMIGGRHRSNTELIAQGIANIGSSLFGGIPATGAIARTATNVKNGGRTPVAGIVHALTLLLILFVFAPLAKLIPLACLAAILVVVAYHMSEWHSFAALLRGPRADVVVLLLTFTLTVAVDLIVAIEVGMVLSSFLFMHRMSAVTKIRAIGAADFREEEEGDEKDIRRRLPDGVELYVIRGPLFFGVAQEFEETMRIVARKPKVQIIAMDHVPAIDATGLHALKSLFEDCRKRGIQIVLYGLRPYPLDLMKRAGLIGLIGEENIVGDFEKAVSRSKRLTI